MAHAPPLASAPLLSAMRALQTSLDAFDRDAADTLGLGRNDALCLRFLVERGPASPGAIMVELGLTSGSVTALLDRLERAGMVLRRPDPSDRRALIVDATRSGHKAVERAVAPLAELAGKLADRLSEDKSGAVVRQLEDLARLVDWAGRSAP